MTVLTAAAGVFLVGIVLVYVFFGNDIVRIVKRAVSGTKAEPGVVIVKTIPSGAPVMLNGESRG